MSLQVRLVNDHPSASITCYISGTTIDAEKRPFFVRGDGQLYFPSLPPAGPPAGLEEDVEIKLGGPGGELTVTIPFLESGRVWFSLDTNIEFRRSNTGGVIGIVSPSAADRADLNFDRNWGFAELTYNTSNLFANVTYVDFVGIPVSISSDGSKGVQTVPGLPVDGFDQIRRLLEEQAGKDQLPWGSLVQNNRRILAPARAIDFNGGGFEGYYEAYVDETYAKYANEDLTVNTQDPNFNDRTGRVVNGVLDFGDGASFVKPSTYDIFDNTTGPFVDGNDLQKVVRTRLAAAFNRSTTLERNAQPNGAAPPDYYQRDPTNYYAKFVHQVNLDGRGYCFPFDEVKPDNGADTGGIVIEEQPTLFTVQIGGASAGAGAGTSVAKN